MHNCSHDAKLLKHKNGVRYDILEVISRILKASLKAMCSAFQCML